MKSLVWSHCCPVKKKKQGRKPLHSLTLNYDTQKLDYAQKYIFYRTTVTWDLKLPLRLLLPYHTQMQNCFNSLLHILYRNPLLLAVKSMLACKNIRTWQSHK
jgi:hypothetical protein